MVALLLGGLVLLSSAQDFTPAVKWDQSPQMNENSPGGGCYYGWDEVSVYAGPQIVADDWLCEKETPVVAVEWWGSYPGTDVDSTPPAGDPMYPMAFHIGVWTDVPVGETSWSHPGLLVWETTVPREAVAETPVGCDFHPSAMLYPETTFHYYVDLPQIDWFWQEPGPTVYWISVAAVYEAQGDYVRWGWLTREHVYGDAAVEIYKPTAPALTMEATFLSGMPIHEPEDQPWDMAFRLITPLETEITGTKWYDLNENLVRDETEVGLGGWIVYLDLDDNGELDLYEPVAETDAQGTYTFRNLDLGTYIVRELLGDAWAQSYPGGQGFAHIVELTEIEPVADSVDFGNYRLEGLDFGDADDAVVTPKWPTLLANDGARHLIVAGAPWLGDATDIPDPEADGQPDPAAKGDDTANNDDEDGVTMPVLYPGSPGNITVQINGPGGFLDAWIDYDGNYNWDPGEKIHSAFLPPGMHTIPATPPFGSVAGTTVARFRISTTGGLAPTGFAEDGEVEDHLVTIEYQDGVEELDFGDARDTLSSPQWPVLMSNNGAAHYIGGPWLGDAADAPDPEFDGQPEASALGDDTDGNDDENGVQIPTLRINRTDNITVEINGAATTPAILDAWIDFNVNMIWEPSEQIFAGPLPNGKHPIPVTPPPHALPGYTFARFRISTQGGLAPTGIATDGEVEDYLVFIDEEVVDEQIDLGDAPDSQTGMIYPTLWINNGAAHMIGGPWLGDAGDAPDPEFDGQPDPNALGDDNLDGNDDEDGVTIPPMQVGAGAAVSFQVNGGGGYVDAWIDFNANTVWETAEQILSGYYPAGTHTVVVTPPAGTPVGVTFARFRISSQGGLSPTGFAMDGEVEDHVVTIDEQEERFLDYGDAPDAAGVSLYPTLLAHNGARHLIGGPWLGDPGDAPDPETDGQPDPGALGDDNSDGNDDEDGVSIPVLYVGMGANIMVQVNGGGGILEVWIDFDRSNSWEASEQVFAGYLAPGTTAVPVTPPASAKVGTTFARFRISSQGGLQPTGFAADGEVEDHVVTIGAEDPAGLDYGDAPDSPGALQYPTLAASNGASHMATGPWLGGVADGPDTEADGQPEPGALGDDTYDGNDDENGVSIPTLIPGQPAHIAVQVNGGGGILDAWIDFNRNGAWEGSEQVAALPLPAGTHSISFITPATAAPGTTFARFRISTAGGLSPKGFAQDGEVEDHIVTIEEEPVSGNDLGDAPDGVGGMAYPTLLASNGAQHIIGGPWLGDDTDAPDAELDGQPDAAAAGDDTLDGNDDENGVAFPTFQAGRTDTIVFEVNGGGGHVDAWIDFNGNSAWEGGEQIVARYYPDGKHTLRVALPPSAVVGSTYARFRISTAGGLAPTGTAEDGEVEDYQVAITAASSTTQIVTVVPGWNWVSFSVIPTDNSLENMLASYGPSNNDEFKTATNLGGSATYYNGQWYGLEGGIQPGVTYKLFVQSINPGPINLSGPPVAQNTPIAITTGWNWVGFTGTATTNVNAAMVNYTATTATDNDELKTSPALGGSATFYGGQWYGLSGGLLPGAGYLLRVGAANPPPLVFGP